MNDHLFVIAIGGTGMRCLESFVHLCAIGMFDLQEIEILLLDTDYSNGNKSRVQQLVSKYNDVKKYGNVEGGTNANTFFSAKLNLYNFGTQYDEAGRDSYRTIAHLTNADANDHNQDVASLFLSPEVQEFLLNEGYRAQTHLGSMLMYHSIVDAARRESASSTDATRDIARFIKLLTDKGENARVFVFGSIFGGTGASSIPIIPKALRDASQILSGKDSNQTIDLKKVKFGSTLLTQYFSFPAANVNEVEKEKIIAKSENFSLNCQAALQFYMDDPTVRTCYRRFYHIGWPNDMKFAIQYKGEIQKGGAKQKNDCHVVELLAASAAYDFFHADDLKVAASDLAHDARYLFRSAEFDGGFKFEGNTFFDQNADKLFTGKLLMFLSLAHLILSSKDMEGAWGNPGTQHLVKFINDPQYKELIDKPEECKTLDVYLREFAYENQKDDKGEDMLVFGWIYQIYASINGGSFLFRPDAFVRDKDSLKKLDMGWLSKNEAHRWHRGWLNKSPNQDKSKDEFAKMIRNNATKPNDDIQRLQTQKERLIAHLFNSLAKVQNYSEV